MRHGGRHGEAVRLRGRARERHRGAAHPRRLRLLQGVPDRALLPRRAADVHRRGHQRDATHHHRQAADRAEPRLMKLDGVRVIDLSLFLPGPQMTLMMADQGAEVIKIENPAEGEPSRHIGLAKAGHTVWFRNTHRGKKSVALNLKTEAGREILLKLAETADVLVESFRPGVVDRLGIGYDVVKQRAPRLVYCSISAFGQKGPLRDKPAHDLAVQALSGTDSLGLGNDGKPAAPNLPSADVTASMVALAGVLMALYRRERTGRGDYVDIAMQDSLMSWLPHATGPLLAEDRPNRPKEERQTGGAAMYHIYETKDGKHVTLGGSEVKFARNLLEALRRPDLVPLCAQPPGKGQ